MEVVIKITKLCNLRCHYCYEYSYLADKKRLSLDELHGIFQKMLLVLKHRNLKEVKFIWHGGEPFTIEPAYYESIWKIQHKIFNTEGIAILNSVQTNLTLLTDEYLKKLKKGLFDSIGVSYDIIGEHRVNTGNKPMQQKILQNMQRLIDNGIPFGVITVLTPAAVKHAAQIYDFFDQQDISISFLPLFLPASGTQPLKDGITEKQIVVAYKKIFEQWLCSPKATRALPLDYHLDDLITEVNAAVCKKEFYDRYTDEWVWVINTDGNVYPYDDEYKPGICYGNIFTSSTEELLNSPARMRLVSESRSRIAAVCKKCMHFGYCSGSFVGDSIYPSYNKSGKMSCLVVKPLLDYMYKRLKQEDMIEDMLM
jgi:uncharacterized protein